MRVRDAKGKRTWHFFQVPPFLVRGWGESHGPARPITYQKSIPAVRNKRTWRKTQSLPSLSLSFLVLFSQLGKHALEGCCAWIGRLSTNSPPIQRHGHSRGFASFVLHPFSFTGKDAQAGTTHRRPASACLPFSFLICSCKALLLQTHSLSSAGTYMRHTQWNTRVISTRSMSNVRTDGWPCPCVFARLARPTTS